MVLSCLKSLFPSHLHSSKSYPCVYMCVCVVSHSVISILCNPMDCSPPDFSIHEILQTRILECVAIPFSSGSSWPRIEPWSPSLQADSASPEPPGKPKSYSYSRSFANGTFQYRSFLDLPTQTIEDPNWICINLHLLESPSSVSQMSSENSKHSSKGFSTGAGYKGVWGLTEQQKTLNTT